MTVDELRGRYRAETAAHAARRAAEARRPPTPTEARLDELEAAQAGNRSAAARWRELDLVHVRGELLRLGRHLERP